MLVLVTLTVIVTVAPAAPVAVSVQAPTAAGAIVNEPAVAVALVRTTVVPFALHEGERVYVPALFACVSVRVCAGALTARNAKTVADALSEPGVGAAVGAIVGATVGAGLAVGVAVGFTGVGVGVAVAAVDGVGVADGVAVGVGLTMPTDDTLGTGIVGDELDEPPPPPQATTAIASKPALPKTTENFITPHKGTRYAI